MSLVIKGGTIVAADRTYKADVLVEGETIKAIGEGSEGRQLARRHGLLRHAGRHRPAHPSRHALHGHELRRQLRERHQGGAVGRHDDGRRFLHPEPQPAADGGVRRLGEALEGRRLRLCLPHVHHLLGRSGARGHGQGRQGGRHDLQAFHGLQGRADGQRRGDVRLVRPLRRAWRDAARPRRERRHRRRAAAALHGQGHNRARGPRAVASAGCRGRGGQSRDHARRPGGRAALYRPHLLHPGARGDRARPRAWQARLWRAADPASRARRERVLQQGLEARGAAGHVAAVPRQDPSGRPVERPARRLAAGGGDRPLRLHHQAEGDRASATSPRSRTAPAASRTACRSCGPMASTPGA